MLDLFAGAGTLGLEALSRGAASAVFVDSGRPAVRCLRENIETLGVAAACRVMSGQVAGTLSRLARGAASQRFRWIFLDPPYKGAWADQTLALIAAGSLFTDDAVIVAEHDRRNPPDATYGSLVRTDLRRYGDTELSFYARQPHEREPQTHRDLPR